MKQDPPSFSRTGESDPRGKRDVPLETSVTSATADDFLVASRLCGFQSKSEYLRYLIERELYGTMTYASRLNRLPGTANPENSR